MSKPSSSSGPRVVLVRVLGIPAPGLAVWKSVEDSSIAGDLDDAPAGLQADDELLLEVEPVGFRWVVRDVLDRGRPTSGPRSGSREGRRRRPHAHPATPPGTVVIAWLPFTTEPTDPYDPEPDDVPGKHRPVVVVRSADPHTLRVRPLFDATSRAAERSRGPRLRHWSAAGLDKASVAGPVTEIPTARRKQTLGMLAAEDREVLGIRDDGSGPGTPRRPTG